MKYVLLYLMGLVFGLGISISGMANPAKVLNFFDIAGTWDPSLAFVMGGALIVAGVGYRFVLGRPAPRLDKVFHLPGKTDLDAALIGGSAVFGIGWGLSGFCPGGVLPVVGMLNTDVLIFVAAMCAGIVGAKALQNRRSTPANPQGRTT